MRKSERILRMTSASSTRRTVGTTGEEFVWWHRMTLCKQHRRLTFTLNARLHVGRRLRTQRRSLLRRRARYSSKSEALVLSGAHMCLHFADPLPLFITTIVSKRGWHQSKVDSNCTVHHRKNCPLNDLLLHGAFRFWPSSLRYCLR